MKNLKSLYSKKYFWVITGSIGLTLIGFYFINNYGVNLCWYDEGSLVRLTHFYKQGNLTFEHLYEQHNEHRPLFPNVIFLVLILLSDHNSRVLMLFSQTIQILTLLGFFYIFKKENANSHSNPSYFLIIPFFLFNFSQFENMLWGNQMAFYMVIFFSVLTLIFIERLYLLNKPSSLLIAIFCGIIASFSSAMGLMIWVAGIFQIITKRWKKEKKNKDWIILFTWTLSGVITWIIYFWKYKKPESHPDLLLSMQEPITFIKYFLLMLGNSTQSIPTAYLFGTIILIITVATMINLLRHNKLNQNSFWVAILVYGFCFAGITSLGRVGFGLHQAISSRYTSFTILIIISLAIIIYNLRTINRFNKLIFIIFSVCLICFGLVGYTKGLKLAEGHKQDRLLKLEIALHYKDKTDEELSKIYPDPTLVRITAQLLEKWNYNAFKK